MIMRINKYSWLYKSKVKVARRVNNDLSTSVTWRIWVRFDRSIVSGFYFYFLEFIENEHRK